MARSLLSTIRTDDPDRTDRLRWRSHATILGVFLVLLLISLSASWAAIELINSTRAYATGEGRYSKAQKMAVLDLHRYISTRNQNDYESFQDIIAVPRGDRMARIALTRSPLDTEAAAGGFLQG